MHRIMIYLYMIDQMIAEAETKRQSCATTKAGIIWQCMQGKEYCYLWVCDCPCSQDNILGAFHVANLEI